MLPVTPKKKPTSKNLTLKTKVGKSSSVDKQIILEQRKEIARLQKLLAKKEVKYQSEIAALKAKLAHGKPLNITIVDSYS